MDGVTNRIVIADHQMHLHQLQRHLDEAAACVRRYRDRNAALVARCRDLEQRCQALEAARVLQRVGG
jgi:phage shock protein A